MADYSVDGYGVSNLGYVGPAGGQVMYIRWIADLPTLRCVQMLQRSKRLNIDLR